MSKSSLLDIPNEYQSYGQLPKLHIQKNLVETKENSSSSSSGDNSSDIVFVDAAISKKDLRNDYGLATLQPSDQRQRQLGQVMRGKKSQTHKETSSMVSAYSLASSQSNKQ